MHHIVDVDSFEPLLAMPRLCSLLKLIFGWACWPLSLWKLYPADRALYSLFWFNISFLFFFVCARKTFLSKHLVFEQRNPFLWCVSFSLWVYFSFAKGLFDILFIFHLVLDCQFVISLLHFLKLQAFLQIEFSRLCSLMVIC